jgi:hypothetical protein
MTVRRNPMKKLILALLLVPAIAQAGVIPTRTLEPIIRVVNNAVYVSDKFGNDWVVETTCQINHTEIKEFTVRGKVLKTGRTIRFNQNKLCEIETIRAV